MTTAEFKKVARLLKEVYAQLEVEALSDGVDIFGEEYLQVRDALRREVLKRLGFTLEEYRDAKELVAPAKKVDVAQQALEASKLTQETSNRIDALKIPDEEELLSKAREIAEAVVKAPVIQNNIVERTTIEKPTIVKETVLQTVNEEYDPSEIFAELGYLNDKLASLKIPEGVDEEKLKEEMRSEFGEQLQHNIDMLGMPDFRKLAMGLQAQIDTLRNTPASSGSGDVVGPASAVDSNFVSFNTTTGKLIKDSGSKAADFATAAQGALADTALQSLAGAVLTTDIGVTVLAQRSFGTAANSNTGDFAPALGTDDNYVTDAEKVIIGNTSGTNTGDNAVNTLYSGLEASKQDVLTGLTASVLELNYIDGVTSAIQTQLDNKLDDTQFSGLSKITVGTVAPVTPSTGDLWVDTN